MSNEKSPAAAASGGLSGTRRALIFVAVAAVVGAALFARGLGRNTQESAPAAPETGATDPAAQSDAPLPRLVEVGSDTCVPCKAMAPILAELTEEYAGRLTVDFADVKKMPGVQEAFGVRVIPTQIFFSAQGEELFRHEGFFAKEDILATWKQFGYNLAEATK